MMDHAPSPKEFHASCDEIQAALFESHDKMLQNPHIRRAINLAQAKGGGHDQFLTGIVVNFDLTLSNKAWVEAERYRFLTFISSMSTMHRAAVLPIGQCCNEYTSPVEIQEAERLQEYYNSIDGDVYREEKRIAYLNLLYNIPAGFELMAGMTTNYRCLRNIYHQRRNHRLPDWHVVCDWIETLPLMSDILN